MALAALVEMGTFQWQEEEAEKAKREAERQEKQSARIEAFSDGVFALSVVLLVLSIKLPQFTHRPLLEDLQAIYPSYVAYVASFLTILVMWMSHHRMFKLVLRTDDWLPFVNGVVLLLVAFTSFPTAVLGEHWLSPDRGVAALFYTATFVVLSFAFQALWFCIAHKKRLVDKDLPNSQIEAITRQAMMGPVMYLVSFGVAFWSPEACVMMNLLYAIYFSIPGLSFVRTQLTD